MVCQTSTRPSDAQSITCEDILEAVRLLDAHVPRLPGIIVTTDALLGRVLLECSRLTSPGASVPFLGMAIVGCRDALAAKALAVYEAKRGRHVLLITEEDNKEVEP